MVHSVEDMNFRVHLQHEFTLLGLDDYLEVGTVSHVESSILASWTTVTTLNGVPCMLHCQISYFLPPFSGGVHILFHTINFNVQILLIIIDAYNLFWIASGNICRDYYVAEWLTCTWLYYFTKYREAMWLHWYMLRIKWERTLIHCFEALVYRRFTCFYSR